jgi:hypothetical protein
MKNQYNAQAAESLFDKINTFSKEEELRNKQDNLNEAEISREEEKENTDAVDVMENDDNPSQEQAEEKLSKKERKEKRKRAKYEAELKEIEGNKIIEAAGKDEDEGGEKGNPITENKTRERREKSRKKHKGDAAVVKNCVSEDTEAGSSKKKHNKETVMSENGISEESELAEGKKLKKKNKKGISVTENGDTEMFEDGKSKKKRKKCQEEIEDICGEEPIKKKLKKNGKYTSD